MGWTAVPGGEPEGRRQAGPGDDGSAQTSRLLDRENISGAKLELTLVPSRIQITLIKGFAAGGSDFEQEALVLGVEEINLGAASGADGFANKLRTERMRGHEQSRKSFKMLLCDIPNNLLSVNSARGPDAG